MTKTVSCQMGCIPCLVWLVVLIALGVVCIHLGVDLGDMIARALEL